MKLALNDVVTWSSSGGGVTTQKTGSVVAVLAPGQLPDKSFGINVRPTVKGRNHESYVIKVKNDKFYWPLVQRLKVLQGQVNSTNSTAPQPAAKLMQNSNVSILKTYNQAPTPVQPQLKNYVGFVLDFSGSMNTLTKAACDDYNTSLTAIKAAAAAGNQETIVSTMKCTTYARHDAAFINKQVNIQNVNPMPYNVYQANGGTPLFSCVNDLIDHFLALPDAKDPNVAFLLLITTDGEDTEGGGSVLGRRIRDLQAKDNWTITFRVPRGYARRLESSGIPIGNILEWDQTERGVEVATAATTKAVDTFYSNRVQGVRGSNSFYANVTLSDAEIQAKFQDITKDLLVYPVYNDSVIQEFIENQGVNYIRGNAFYELTKPEDVQNYKEVIVQDTVTGKIYGNADARTLLNIPSHGTIRLRPGHTGKYTVFIQSTSVNRKLIKDTRVIYKR